jgi:hypothetical protein
MRIAPAVGRCCTCPTDASHDGGPPSSARARLPTRAPNGDLHEDVTGRSSSGPALNVRTHVTMARPRRPSQTRSAAPAALSCNLRTRCSARVGELKPRRLRQAGGAPRAARGPLQRGIDRSAHTLNVNEHNAQARPLPQARVHDRAEAAGPDPFGRSRLDLERAWSYTGQPPSSRPQRPAASTRSAAHQLRPRAALPFAIASMINAGGSDVPLAPFRATASAEERARWRSSPRVSSRTTSGRPAWRHPGPSLPVVAQCGGGARRPPPRRAWRTTCSRNNATGASRGAHWHALRAASTWWEVPIGHPG